MARMRYKPEEIVAKLRQVDVLVSQGQNIVDAIRQIGVSEVTYYRWRQEFGGLKTEQVKRLKELELENSRLRKAVSDLTLDKLILQEAARAPFFRLTPMDKLFHSMSKTITMWVRGNLANARLHRRLHCGGRHRGLRGCRPRPHSTFRRRGVHDRGGSELACHIPWRGSVLGMRRNQPRTVAPD